MIYKNENKPTENAARDLAYRVWMNEAMRLDCDCNVISAKMCAFITDRSEHFGDTICYCECHVTRI